MQTDFFNTIKEKNTTLQDSIDQARHQEAAILRIFKFHHSMTPFEVQDRLEQADFFWPITSVRRAITVLTKSGKLEKTQVQRQGPYGKANYVWRLK